MFHALLRLLRRRAFNSLWTAPALTLLFLGILFVAVPAALGAPANPTGVTAQSCTFGSGWMDGLSRWIFGASMLFFALAALSGLQARSSSSGGGGDAIGGAVGGIAGVGVVLGLLGGAGLLAAIAIAAAGGTACP